jgi:DNA-binding NarL/FixJ family response regulator
LPACIEILLATAEIEPARTACLELEETARGIDTDVLHAMAAQARGALQLAEGSAESALLSLRRAAQLWQRLSVPYASARARVLLGLACRELGDEAGANLELGAARAVFQQLGAAPDVLRVDVLTGARPQERAHGLTERELAVLRLIASGKTNKAIAAALCLSEKTIERHVSNLFTRLGVPSRAAATAYAYEHHLI